MRLPWGNWFTNGNGTGLEYSNKFDMVFTGLGTTVGVFESGATIGTLQSLKTISFSTAKTALKVVKHAGTAGVVLGGAVALHEFATGHDNTHTLFDIGVTVAGVVAVGVLGTAALPAVVVGGLIYGIWSAAGGSDFIDNNIGYRDTKTRKLKWGN